MRKIDLHNDPKIETGFKVPEDYFQSFEDRIMSQLQEKEVKVVPLWQRKPVWYSGVAAVFMLSIGTWMYYNQQSEVIYTSSEEYLAYENDITHEDIALHLTDEDITSIEKDLGLYDSESETYVNEYLN
nr:hypothetical protein [uncultured Flavobacterium sp.]